MFRDGDDVVLLSRSGQDLGRYFPGVIDAVRDELAPRCVLDGEILVPREIGGRTRLDWESLSQRLDPAESRIKELSAEVKFLRWRPDRHPDSCTFAQLDVPLHYDLSDVLEKN